MELENIRIREKQRNMFFGRILRDHTKSLKQQSIQSNAQIVVQVLEQPEVLDANMFVLLLCKRNVSLRTYMVKQEVKFIFPGETPRLEDLVNTCRVHLSLLPSEEISVAKYVPHIFEWKWMNPEEDHVEKVGKKKKTEIHFKTKDADLRKMPFLLKDGDIIGIRVESENLNHEDDF